ncbi:60S acidic ribosomal protein P2B isoform X2 [Gossypium hirsutum]|uniref:60S acidic ribosomal protein P2B isoform X2 n=1 Tax=Gossypium hirsutum TaxID=3635 RepID=A0ABM3BJN0_GOSHI|nr:60S acidic ribosomal protein P2B-like isoform X2 [Gossypium hirsutum]
MKVVAAYFLAVLGSKTNPSAADIKKILASDTFNTNLYLFSGFYFLLSVSVSALGNALVFGAEADDDKIQLLLSEMKGKDVTEIIASGREKLASVPCGGGGVVAAAPGASAAAGTPAAAEAKKEEKVEEKAESSDDDMGFSLFD